MKKQKRALFLSMLMLMMVIAIGSTSTFAWFSLTSKPEVEDFVLTVSSNEGLLLSATPSADGLKSVLPKQDIIDAYNIGKDENEKFDNLLLEPVMPYYNTNDTSENHAAINTNNKFNFENFKKISFDGTTISVDGTTEGYLSFNLYFVSKEETSVYLAHESSITSTESELNKDKVLSPINDNVNIFNTTTGDISEDGTSLEKGKTSIDTAASNAIRIGTKAGDTQNLYDLNSEEGWSGSQGVTKINMAEEYFKFMNNYDDIFPNAVEPNVTLNGNSYVVTDRILKLTKVEDNDNGLGDFKGKFGDDIDVYAGVATVYIWFDGTDADCFDAAFNDKLSVSLNFFARKVSSEPTTDQQS